MLSTGRRRKCSRRRDPRVQGRTQMSIAVTDKVAEAARPAPEDWTGLSYQPGFANEHESEAVAGALPRGRNSPQAHDLGLYTEQINATAFTAPRADNRRSWV